MKLLLKLLEHFGFDDFLIQNSISSYLLLTQFEKERQNDIRHHYMVAIVITMWVDPQEEIGKFSLVLHT